MRAPQIVAVALLFAFAATATAPPKKKKRVPSPPPVTAAQRAEAQAQISKQLLADDLKIENAGALTPFYEALEKQLQPVHILQFGDSHTASDDWVNSMRALLQAKYGDGGPGFVQAGRPYKGYRRFDAHGQSSAGWKTEGTMALRGDAQQGLSGISISTTLAGQTVSLSASGDVASIFYMQQPGGGAVEFAVDNMVAGTFQTDGEAGPGAVTFPLTAGTHELTLRTLDHAPVRLFGWAIDNHRGVSVETLGINGAQVNVILGWNETLWASELAARTPSLVIIAYGTNEANSTRWTPEQYRADLLAVIDRVRRAAPAASLLMIGPPDCGKTKPLLHLAEVVAEEREIAHEQKVAFWDWRSHMGGAGAIRRWVTAGYAQTDFIHMTGEGYRMIGELIVTSLLERRQDEQAGENH